MFEFSTKSSESLTLSDIAWQTVPQPRSSSTESSVANSNQPSSGYLQLERACMMTVYDGCRAPCMAWVSRSLWLLLRSASCSVITVPCSLDCVTCSSGWLGFSPSLALLWVWSSGCAVVNA